MFSCEFSKISKNTFFTEHLRKTASAFSFSEAATGGALWKKGVLENFAKFKVKHLSFAKFSKTPFLQNNSGRLLLLLAFQKQPPEVFYEKRCSWIFGKIHRKTPLVCEIFKNTFFTSGRLLLAFSCNVTKMRYCQQCLENLRWIFII